MPQAGDPLTIDAKRAPGRIGGEAADGVHHRHAQLGGIVRRPVQGQHGRATKGVGLAGCRGGVPSVDGSLERGEINGVVTRPLGQVGTQLLQGIPARNPSGLQLCLVVGTPTVHVLADGPAVVQTPRARPQGTSPAAFTPGSSRSPNPYLATPSSSMARATCQAMPMVLVRPML